jgi:hypothetical protein
MENLATYYFSSVFEFSPNFFNFWKVGKFCWKITNFSQFFHQKQISQNRENFATKKKKKKKKQQQQKSLAENLALFCHLPTFMEMYLLEKPVNRPSGRGPLKRGLPCQNRPLHFCSTIFVWISGRVFFYFPLILVVWQSSKFGDRSETKKSTKIYKSSNLDIWRAAETNCQKM